MEHKINQSIENTGWEQMKALLDQEIPVKKQSRKIGVWWWTGAAASIILAVGILINSNDSNNNKPIAQSPIIQVEPDHSNDSKITKTSIPEEQISKAKENDAVNNTSNKITPSILNNIQHSKKDLQSVLSNLSFNRVNNSVESSQTNINTTSNTPHIEDTPVIKSENKSNFISEFTALTIQPTDKKYIELPNINKIEFENLDIHKSANNRFFVDAGYIRGSSTLMAGLGKSYTLNERWTLDASVQYRTNVNPNTSINESASMNQSTLGGTITNVNTLDQETLNNAANGEITLPVALKYSLSKKWHITGGGQLHYLLLKNDASASQNINFSTADNLNSEIAKLSVRGRIGLQYYLSELISLFGSYQPQIWQEKKSLSIDQQSDLAIGLRYEID